MSEVGVKVLNEFRRKATEVVAVCFGAALLLLLLFRADCVQYSTVLQALLAPVESFIFVLSSPFVFVFEVLLIFFDFPRPQTDMWKTIFAFSIFHQSRTFMMEIAVPERRRATSVSFFVAFIVGGCASYLIGVFHPLSKPSSVVLSISFLYALLEFLRYTIYALLRREPNSMGFILEFRRRNLRYTLAYLLIALLASLVSFYFFGDSDAVIPAFAILLFLFLSIYLLILEAVVQMGRKLRNEIGVGYFESTVTQTAVLFLAIIVLSTVAIRIDQRQGLLDLVWSCSKS